MYVRFRYPIDSVTVAFELRKPGEYVYEHIELLPYNTETQQFLPTTRVANSFGDAGYIYELQSLMRDLDGDGSQDLLQRKYESYLDVEADTLVFARDSLFQRLWVDSMYTWRTPLLDTTRLRDFAPLEYE